MAKLLRRLCCFRAIAVGLVAVGSKGAALAKSAGGAGGLVKGIGTLVAAGYSHLLLPSLLLLSLYFLSDLADTAGGVAAAASRPVSESSKL